jgi:hypothetical protein
MDISPKRHFIEGMFHQIHFAELSVSPKSVSPKSISPKPFHRMAISPNGNFAEINGYFTGNGSD